MSTTPAPVPAPRMSSPARIVGAIVSPGRTFADLAREPHFILCWCVQAVVGVVFGYAMIHRVGVFAMARKIIMSNPRVAADPVQAQRAIAVTAAFTKYSLYFQPVIAILVLVIMAAIVLGIGNFLLGYEATFKQAVAVTSHAYLTLTVSALAALSALLLMPDPTNFNLVNPIGTNYAYFLDKATTSPFLYNLALHFDIISIWAVLLLALGLAAMGGRKGKFGSALAGIGGLWLFYVLAVSGIATAFA